MTSVLWIIATIVFIVLALLAIGICGLASEPYGEQECEATVERSNGLSQEFRDWSDASDEDWRRFDEQLNKYEIQSGDYLKAREE